MLVGDLIAVVFTFVSVVRFGFSSLKHSRQTIVIHTKRNEVAFGNMAIAERDCNYVISLGWKAIPLDMCFECFT